MPSKLTDNARGQDCTLQLYPYCNGNTETVVFCHYNSARKGFGIKSPDYFGAFGCSACHDVIDNRIKHDIPGEELQALKLAALQRTLQVQIESNLITIPKGCKI